MMPAGALFTVFLFLSSTLRAAPPLPPSPLPPETSNEGLSGREVYEKECAVCHGQEGQGTERGYALRFPAKTYAEAVVRRGRTGNRLFEIPMPAYSESQVTTTQLNEMIAYLNSFERPKTGKALYETFCGACHGIDGRGGFTGKNIIKEIEEFSEYIRKGKGLRDPLNRKNYMPPFRSNELSSLEIRLMRDHAIELRKQAGYPSGGHHGDDDDDEEEEDEDD